LLPAAIHPGAHLLRDATMTRRSDFTEPSEYAIRPARIADLDRLEQLLLLLQDHLEAANPDLWRMTGAARTQLRGQIRARLTAPGSCAIVAEHSADGVVGMIFGRVATNERYAPARAGIVDQVFVHEAHRRAGVGSRLVAELWATLPSRVWTTIAPVCDRQPAGRRLWRASVHAAHRRLAPIGGMLKQRYMPTSRLEHIRGSGQSAGPCPPQIHRA
jgi:GNAT superfamily N-acetyltransferase